MDNNSNSDNVTLAYIEKKQQQRANWAPYDTHVITPEKMLKFYSCYQIENERLPFRGMFPSQPSFSFSMNTLPSHVTVSFD